MVFLVAALSAAAAVALTGAMSGLFFAFSVSVLPGLDGIGADRSVPAMQSMNRRIQNGVFFTAFFGAPAAALAAGVLLLLLGQAPAGTAFFAAGAVYLVGAFLPTVAVNVPMNERLDAVEASSDAAGAARIWSEYSPRWTRWNTLRAVSASAGLLLAGLGVFLWGMAG